MRGLNAGIGSRETGRSPYQKKISGLDVTIKTLTKASKASSNQHWLVIAEGDVPAKRTS
jgi:hypothetical protein